MYRELIGFDIRLCPEDYVEVSWDQKRRKIHLLRSEIRWPLSVDIMVWPSSFRYSGILYQPDTFSAELVNVAPNNPRQEGLKLWSDLEEMKALFLAQKGKRERCVIVTGFKIISEEPLKSIDWWRAVLDPVVSPGECPKDWISLGYDVADRDLISGLSNCGYTDDEKPLLQQDWSSRINEFGLLKTLEDAVEYQRITERRVPEHAPFYVYGLFRDPAILKSSVS